MRLIDADEAIKRLGDSHFKNYGNAIMVIRETPPVDAEPVIRCMDCKWFGAWYCDLLHFGIVDLHKYCAWAERKEE